MSECTVAEKVGRMSALLRYVAYACQIAASTARIRPLRTQPLSQMRSQSVSGAWMTPISCSGTASRTTSGRSTTGGRSAMRRLLFQRLPAEKHLVDAVREALARRRIRAVLAVAAHFRAHLPRMRREQQHAVADAHRLGNRMRDEEDGEAGLVPQAQQLVLHAP